MEKPPPPPEAALIRVALDAAGFTAREAAARAGISKARLSQIAGGYETRGDVAKVVHAKPGTLARVARHLGITPEQLETEGQRRDAAEVLREILRREPAAEPEPPPRPDDPSDVRLYLVDATDAALRTDADIIAAAIDAGTFTPADSVESVILRQQWDSARRAAEIANFRARVAAHDTRARRRAQLAGGNVTMG
jgi:transcriptional regulator with XRE-family HTH domain